mmetsp:Transcript_78120/g.232681  ORF Transcript_78120/g.232681 Transcript_78120/m.232681 type:complete len:286 (-) Transcript_78120:570-1427(-)
MSADRRRRAAQPCRSPRCLPPLAVLGPRVRAPRLARLIRMLPWRLCGGRARPTARMPVPLGRAGLQGRRSPRFLLPRVCCTRILRPARLCTPTRLPGGRCRQTARGSAPLLLDWSREGLPHRRRSPRSRPQRAPCGTRARTLRPGLRMLPRPVRWTLAELSCGRARPTARCSDRGASDLVHLPLPLPRSPSSVPKGLAARQASAASGTRRASPGMRPGLGAAAARIGPPAASGGSGACSLTRPGAHCRRASRTLGGTQTACWEGHCKSNRCPTCRWHAGRPSARR